MNNNAVALNADSLFACGNYFEATIEYERMIFKADNPDHVNYYKYKKAMCFKKLRSFDRVLEELQSVYIQNPKDSLYLPVSYEQSLCFYLNGEPIKALWKIDEYFHRSIDSSSFQIFIPIRLFCLNETLQWDKARECFLEFIEMQNFTPEKDAELKQFANSLYNKKNLRKFKSPGKAEIMSRIIPGTGQIYAGMAGEGVVNFIINASLISFTAYQVYNGFYITGYLAGLGFFNKTYHGGIKHAEMLASRKNKEFLAEINSEINAVIRSSFNLN